MDWSQQWRRLVVVLGLVVVGIGAFGTLGEAGELGHYQPWRAVLQREPEGLSWG